jgi:hypothetical protein
VSAACQVAANAADSGDCSAAAGSAKRLEQRGPTLTPVSAYLPPATFVVAWVLALLGVPAIGTDASTPFVELALRWMLFMGAGWSVLGGSVAHTVFRP